MVEFLRHAQARKNPTSGFCSRTLAATEPYRAGDEEATRGLGALLINDCATHRRGVKNRTKLIRTNRRPPRHSGSVNDLFSDTATAAIFRGGLGPKPYARKCHMGFVGAVCILRKHNTLYPAMVVAVYLRVYPPKILIYHFATNSRFWVDLTHAGS